MKANSRFSQMNSSAGDLHGLEALSAKTVDELSAMLSSSLKKLPLNILKKTRMRSDSADSRDLLSAVSGMPTFQPCKHKRSHKNDIFQRNSCAGNAFVGFLRNFLAGVSVKVLVKLLRAITIMKMPALVGPRGLLDEDTLRFGLFTGGFTGIYRAALCLLRNLIREDSLLNAYCAGYLASVVIYILPAADRIPIAAYLFVRALRVIVEGGLRHHTDKMPKLFTNFKHFDTTLFSFTAGVILFCYVCRPDALPKSYMTFLMRAGRKDPRVLHALGHVVADTKWDSSTVLSLIQDQKQPENLLMQRNWNGPRTQNYIEPMCQLLHPGLSCHGHWVDFTLRHMATISLRFYLPLNVIAMLVFNRKRFMNDPQESTVRMGKSVMRSALFLSLYCGNAWAFQCGSRRAGLLTHTTIPVFMAIGSGLTILLEEKSRRLELAMYCLSPTIQALYNLGRDAGYVHTGSQEGHVATMFAFAMGVIMTAHEMDLGHLQPTFEQILKNLLGLN